MKKRITKFFSVFLSILILLSVIPMTAGAVTAEFAGGNGTEEEPYLISTTVHLDNVRKYPDAYFKLINDISFTSDDYSYSGDFYNSGTYWQPIDIFSGSFDGNDYTIDGIKMSYDYSGEIVDGVHRSFEEFGLFSLMFGRVFDLNLTNVNISIRAREHTFYGGSSSTHVYVGGIAGECVGEISDCSVAGKITVTGKTGLVCIYAGGIAGMTDSYYDSPDGIIRNCINSASIRCTAYYSESVFAVAGGIVGYHTANDIENCTNNGKIEAASYAETYAGGIAAFSFSNDHISLCNNIGTVSVNATGNNGYGAAGGIIGFSHSKVRIQNCGNFAKITAEGLETSSGGIVGLDSQRVFIKNSFNTGEISAVDLISYIDMYAYHYAGGIVANGISEIEQCYNTGNVTVEGNDHLYAGGISGLNFGTVRNSYNTGDISVQKDAYESEAAGLVSQCCGTAEYCYNAGNVYGTETGGIANDICDGSYDDIIPYVSDCYFLDNVSEGFNEILDDTSVAVHKKTSSEMKNQSTFTNFDFNTIWLIPDDSYPQLRKNLQTEVIPEDHKYTCVIIKESTCTETGIKRFTCVDCGLIVDLDMNKTAHKLISVVTAPTCTERGYTTYTCYCGYSYTANYVNATGHSYDSVVTTPATHTATGIMTYTCICGDSYTEVIPKTEEHAYVTEVTLPATHTAIGIMTYTCICGDSYTEVIPKTKGHTYSSEITSPATHTATGIMTYTCICGDSYTEVIQKLPGHSYVTVVTSPTCTAMGYTTFTCACGYSYTSNYVNANGHSYVGSVTTPATHNSTGVKTYTCFCGSSYTEIIEKLTAHEYNAVVTEPTCSEGGYTTYTCICGDSYISDYTNAKGHSHKATVTVPATHLSEGVMTYTCACGDSYTESIGKISGHTYKETLKKEATHLTEGLMEYTCECGDSYQTAIPTLPGHTYESEIISEPKCKEDGIKLFVCECGHSYTETVYRLGHVDDDDNGSCDRCGVSVCSHMCHKTGFMGFIWKIVLFFSKLFGSNPVCECGAAHY